jgi:large subunit ribosomal protein L24
LSPELKEKHGTNAVPVRVGDTVRIMRGDRKGFEGKISRVDRTKYRIFVEGVTRTKVDGSTIPISIHPSKAMITTMNLDDKWRRKTLERKGPKPAVEEAPVPVEVVKKPEEKRVEEKPKKKERTRKPRGKRKEEAEPAQRKVASKTKKVAKPKAKPRRRGAKKAEAAKGEE